MISIEPSGAGVGLIVTLLLSLGGLVFLAAWAGSIAWVWRDANRRGQPGFIVAVLVALLCWPMSLLVWRVARRAPGAPPDGAKVWPWVLAVVLLLVLTPIGILTWHHVQAVRKAEALANQPRRMTFFKAGSSAEETRTAAEQMKGIPGVVDVQSDFHAGLLARPGSPVDSSFVRPLMHASAVASVKAAMDRLGYIEM